MDKKRLVTACQTGNREAQALLYTTYRRKMLKIIRQYVADYDMAQDVLHDGFLIIFSQIQSLRKPESLDYWMATIMKNLAIHTLSQINFKTYLKNKKRMLKMNFTVPSRMTSSWFLSNSCLMDIRLYSDWLCLKVSHIKRLLICWASLRNLLPHNWHVQKKNFVCL